jgi:AP-1 complex subunit mu
MSGISAIYFLDKKGRPIIFRNYRGEVTQDISSNFQKKVLELEESNMKPLFSINDVHYCWIRYKNIYIVAVSKRNPDICMVFFFLHRLIDLLIGYFNVLEDESIRDNFVLIYELLDEIMDHGYPQNTDAKLLKEYIKTSSYRLAIRKKLSTEVINNQVSRAPGIKYQVNQAFVDVTERVSSLISHKGEMLRSDIIGVITMKTMLSGMPLLKLGLNDKSYFDITVKKSSGKTIEIDDFKFHNCVNINKFEAERVIEFIPPDGFFTLMNYRLNLKIKPLIWVEVERKELTPTKMKYLVRAKSNCKPKSTANNVCIMIPVPVDLQNPLFKSSLGSVTYSPDKEVLIWNIKRFPGMKETNLIIQFNVPSLRANDNTKAKYLKKPIEVKFEIPSFTVSGIQVRYLKITEASGYQAYPYVKYVTKNGEYQIRMD